MLLKLCMVFIHLDGVTSGLVLLVMRGDYGINSCRSILGVDPFLVKIASKAP